MKRLLLTLLLSQFICLPALANQNKTVRCLDKEPGTWFSHTDGKDYYVLAEGELDRDGDIKEKVRTMEILVCTSHVKNLDYLFYGAENYQGKLYLASYWDTSNVTSMVMMFDSVQSRSGLSLDLRGWDTSKVTNMARLFAGIRRLHLRGIEHLDVSNVVNMSGMFEYSNITGNFQYWDTSKVKDMSRMFSGNRVILNGGSPISGL